MLYRFPLEVPTYNAEYDSWSTTTFNTLEEFRAFCVPLFKEPGKYEFDDTALKFNEQARLFNSRKFYCNAAFKSKDFVRYWDHEKEKCTKGAIFINGAKTWYLPRDYYMWINFLPIYDKEENHYGFAKVRDVQYHMALYELLAEIHYKHAPILKKRQIASSYFHMAKFINAYYFESGAVLKIGASREDYINLKGSWRFLNEYRDFLNKHTAWYRACNPDKTLNWQQRMEVVSADGKKSFRGNKSQIMGTSFEKDPTAGVGGPCLYFFHEEGGIAPKADTTFSFMKPAMKSGMITTGMFIIAGSVGELDKCKPLEEMILRPTSEFYTVTTNLLDEDGSEGVTGLFIPEQWGMPPYIDAYGNSLVPEALEAIREQREEWKREFSPEKYQYEISQQPINIKEAFAYRKQAIFPTHLVQKRLKQIENGEVFLERLDVYRDEHGVPRFRESRRPPNDYPTDKKAVDKRGCCIVHERPDSEKPAWGRYVASVDPVGEGRTTTSDSHFAITIYKMPVERTEIAAEGNRTTLEGDKQVCSWTGRFDDINETHEYASMLIEMYNAQTVVEANISLFTNYMILKNRQKYLVSRNMLVFNKDQKAASATYQEYGWKNVGTVFKMHLINYAIEYCREEIDAVLGSNGEKYSTTYGVERISDPALLREMLAYQDGVNVDRLVAFTALVAYVKLQVANSGYHKEISYKENLQESKEKYKLSVRPFRNIGRANPQDVPPEYRPRKPTFRNLK